MASIENYVCTIEQSLKLRELGVKKESVFFWGLYDGRYDCLQTDYIDRMEKHLNIPLYKKENRLPAYTLQDLYEIMSNLDFERGYEMRQELLDGFSYGKEIYDPKFIADHIINHIECLRELAAGECENGER